MTTQIEILTAEGSSLKCAYYYVVPVADRLASAADPARVPLGSALTPTEVQALKDGVLHEIAARVTVPLNVSDARAILQDDWTLRTGAALTDYEKRYFTKAYVGSSWDGSTWSVP